MICLVVMLSVVNIRMTIIMLIVTMQNVTELRLVILSVFMVSVIRINVVMLNVAASSCAVHRQAAKFSHSHIFNFFSFFAKKKKNLAKIFKYFVTVFHHLTNCPNKLECYIALG